MLSGNSGSGAHRRLTVDLLQVKGISILQILYILPYLNNNKKPRQAALLTSKVDLHCCPSLWDLLALS